MLSCCQGTSALKSDGSGKPGEADCVSALGTFLQSDSQRNAYYSVSRAPNHNTHLFCNVL